MKEYQQVRGFFMACAWQQEEIFRSGEPGRAWEGWAQFERAMGRVVEEVGDMVVESGDVEVLRRYFGREPGVEAAMLCVNDAFVIRAHNSLEVVVAKEFPGRLLTLQFHEVQGGRFRLTWKLDEEEHRMHLSRPMRDWFARVRELGEVGEQADREVESRWIERIFED